MSGPRVEANGGRPTSDAWRAGLVTWLLGTAAWIQLVWQAYRTGVLSISPRWQAVLLLGLVALVASAVWLRSTRRHGASVRGREWTERLGRIAQRKIPSLAAAFLIAAVFPLAVFGPGARYAAALAPRLLIFWIVSLTISYLLAAWFPRTPWRQRLIAALIGYGLVVRLLVSVPELSTYPFSLGWSETSRYYYASLFRAEAIYGQPAALPELHPTRYFLQSLPFFLGELPLWAHRLWQTLLWWLLPVATAALLVRRHRLTGGWIRFLVGGWIVLYLFQGPVYYHLLVAVVLILAGVDARHPWRSTVFVLLASLWAGLSRLNWYPVPGLLAASLLLVEIPQGTETRRKRLAWPAAWVVAGTLTAIASQAVYVGLSGFEADRVTSSLSSALLFYRLLPNATYGLGILPAALMASAPLLISLWWSRAAWLPRMDAVRGVSLAAALLLLGAGGVLVSLKIGGGSNLHNLDAYLILLLLIGSSLLLQAAGRDPQPGLYPGLPPFRSAALLIAVPVIFAVAAGGRWLTRDFVSADESLEAIRAAAQDAAGRGERVLFISQRQLLTFGLVPGVPLEPEYETVFLMEMAMSGNQKYLDRFHAQLEDQDFGLIVVDRLSTALQGARHNFGEENDAWVTEVSRPLLCSYEYAARFERPPVDLLVPRTTPTACPEE